jgi:hypothetical protein
MNSFPHMCRDDHPEIGYSGSETELCPLCHAIAAREEAVAMVKRAVEILRECNTSAPAIEGWLEDVLGPPRES